MSLKISVLLSLFASFILLNETFAQNCSVNANVDQNICFNQSLTLVGNSSGLINGSTTWTQVSGPSVIINSPNSLVTGITGFSPGVVYTFRLTALCQDGAIVSDESSVTIRPITISQAGVDQASCPGTLTLNGNAPSIGETGLWTIVGANNAGLVINTPTSPTSTVTLPAGSAGSTTLRWVITSPNGCVSNDNMVVTNYGGVMPVTAGADQNLSNCYTAFQSTTLTGSFGGNSFGGQVGTWMQVSGPNYASIGSPNASSTGVGNLIEGTYVFRWTVSGPCASGTDDVSVTVPAGTQNVTSVNGVNVVFCSGVTATTVVLEGTVPAYSNETITWVQTGGPAITIANPNSPSTLISGLDGSSTYTFSYNLINTVTSCASSDNSVTVSYVNIAPSVTLPADIIGGSNDTTFSIPFLTTGGTATRYSIVSGPFTTGFLPTTNPLNLTLNQTGTYTIRVERYTNGIQCASAFDDMQITVSLQPSASNAGTAQNLACNVTSTSLAGNIPLTGIGSWSQVSGPNTATIVTPNMANSNVTGMVSGLYVFRWTISSGPGCTPRFSDALFRVRTPLLPANASAGVDQTVCAGSSITLGANNPPASATGTWTVSPSGPVFSNSNNPTATVTGLAASTVYTFTWTVSNVCGSVSSNVLVTVNSTTGATIANAGANACLPAGTTSTNLNGNAIAIGTGTWAFVSGPNMPTIASANLSNTAVNGLVNGSYLFEWSSTVSGCQVTRDTILLTIAPTTSIANAGIDQTVCGSSVSLSGNNPTIGVGNWTQVSGPGGALISAPSLNNTSVSNLTNGEYNFVWTISNGACASISNDTVNVKVSLPPTVSNAGVDQIICNVTSATLSGNVPTSGVGVWSIVGGATNSPVISNANSNTSTVTGLATGIYTFRWSIFSGSYCPVSTDDVEIRISAPATAGADQQFCQETAVQLIGTPGSTGVWSLVSGPASAISANSGYTATATISANNTYIYQYTANSIFGCPSTSDQMTVTNSQYGTTPIAGPDQSICLSSGSSITMAGNTITTGTGTWSLAFGPNSPTITSPNSPTSTVTGLIQGLYVFNWNSSNGNCSSFNDVVRINVYNPPTTSNAGADQLTACQTAFALSGNLPTNGIGTWSQVSGPSSAVFNFPNQPTTTLSSLVAGSYVFRWTIVNGPACPASVDDVTINFPAAVPTTPMAGPDQSLCNVTSTPLAGNTIATGAGSWSLFSGPNAPTFTANNPTTSLGGLTSGTYVMLWNSLNGGCSFNDTVQIVNYSLPSVANAGSDRQFCPFQAITMAANVPTSGTGFWTQVSGPNTAFIQNPNSAISNIVGTTPGVYVFNWTISNGSCASSIDPITITVLSNCPPTTVNEVISMNEDVAFTGTVGVNGILNNGDSDSEGQPLVVAGVIQGPSNGTFTFSSNGAYTYTPDSDFNGNDTVIVSVCDNGSPILCAADTIFVTVNPVNDPPIANTNSAITVSNVSVVFTPIQANDSDVETFPNPATIDLNVLSGGQQTTGTSPNGSWSVNTTTGEVTYVPNSNFVGLDSIIYSICDDGLPLPILCDTAYLYVRVYADKDADGVSDLIDLDDDNDGISDYEEVCGIGATDFSCLPGGEDPSADSDGDGILNYQDPDFCVLNSNGVCADLDSDGDGVPNFLDLDSDNDGISDVVESGGPDPDGDGVAGTGVPTVNSNGQVLISGSPVIVGNEDTDNDGVPDSQDLDSDNDGINDLTESGADVATLDPDGNGVIDGADTDNDGITDLVDGNVGTFGGSTTTPVDTDNDGTPDFNDLDSDNDGINDLTESGADVATLDPDGNGVIDGVDTDNDGITDLVDGTVGTFGGSTTTPVDTDNDGTPDFNDLDSDNDGISDLVESGADVATLDADGNGVIDGVDTDNDGITDLVDGNVGTFGGSTTTPVDTDNDGTPDFNDLDSDNDGINDLTESGADVATLDPDGNGVIDGVDTDNDGITDLVDGTVGTFGGSTTTPVDTDNDGTPDFNDLDSDNDGINDLTESGADVATLDPDGNGVIDGVDIDNDGITDSVDGNVGTFGGSTTTPVDTDNDGTPDFNDLDSDNDGINDLTESGADVATLDADGNGVIDGVDTDNDGITDLIDGTVGTFGGATTTPVDTDNDGTPDFNDLDSDNDGINDLTESGADVATLDADGNGVIDGVDTDNDGITDSVDGTVGTFGGSTTTPVDTDNDGTPDFNDLDSDNDGINDLTESGADVATLDPDGNGVIDGTDSDNDGITDSVDGTVGTFGGSTTTPIDTDNDGTIDVLDLDSDNDGINDLTESGADVAILDADGNGVIDGVDTDNDGITDLVDGNVGTFGGSTTTPVDTDNDGTPDFNDLDSDNDGISDLVESGADVATLDPDGNGVIDGADTDGDGITDLVDGNIGTFGGATTTPVDTDNDGTPDFNDLDSDNDGINDLTESGADVAILDADGNGVIDGVDTDNDGITDLVDGNVGTFGGSTTTPVDTDNDGTPDFNDLDSDNDGINDLTESGADVATLDADGNGVIDGADTDNDGITDSVDGTVGTFGGATTTPVDTDNDGTPDFNDLDSDNDGINDLTESGADVATLDPDGNGVIDGVDTDNDGITDSVDGTVGTFGGSTTTPVDTDNDGTPDFNDLDSDNDGVSDLVESGADVSTVDTDGNGVIDGGDSDNDGINDLADANVGFGDDNVPTLDSDGDGAYDFQDLDSDNDGISDLFESGADVATLDPDGNGVIDGVDTDNDGITDLVDGNVGTFGGATTTPVDTDNDGTADFNDLDSDNDGINDLTESGADVATLDPDGNGVIDGTDSDNDGITDSVDGNVGTFGGSTTTPVDTDNDGTPDFNDLDSDNDGINDLTESGADVSTVDVNGDGIVDGVDTDGDGINDLVDTNTGFGDDNIAPVDTDNDGTPDYNDLDSDNDGISDLVESGVDVATVDADGNGVVDGGDSDDDGINDLVDTNNGFGDDDLAPLDSDGDGNANYVDLDSDNDGINDLTESGADLTTLDADGNGVIDGADTDNDGITDLVDGTVGTFGGSTTTPVDTDNDGADDLVDLDSDNDGIYDLTESGSGASDSNEDGVVDGTDTDGDGIINDTHVDSNGTFGGTANPPVNSDGDTRPNYLDIDSDNDGITDLEESGSGASDANQDGVIDGTDTDGDGIINDPLVDNNSSFGGNAPLPTSTDGDGKPNYVDIDSDNDGIPDNLEGQPTTGYVAPTGLDSDNDGLDDAYDVNSGGTSITPEDTDGDGDYDYVELDSDNDGITDDVEAWDFNNDGVPDHTYTGIDSDNDGLDDGYEGSNVNDGFDANDEFNGGSINTNNTDGDSEANYRDTDSDNDGILDSDEYDENGDGTPDDCDGDGIPNYLDKDVCELEIPEAFTPDGDGINDEFKIPNLEYYPNNDLTIFNRWGNVVYQVENYQNDWRGTTNSNLNLIGGGEDLPTGTYYYVFIAKNANYEVILNKVYKGFVYIQR